jgi:primosomal protein N' (replication factor Y)
MIVALRFGRPLPTACSACQSPALGLEGLGTDGVSKVVEVLGPAVAPIARIRGRYRFRVVLRSADRRALRHAALAAMTVFGELDNRVRVVVDVDPVGML